MKKLFIILLLILLGGCQKNFNNIVDSQPESYQVIGVYTPAQFTYTPGDSLITISIKLNTSANVKKVVCNILSPDQNQLNNSPVQLFDNGNLSENGDTVKGDLVYSNKFPLSHYYPKGSYEIEFYITPNSGNTKLAAVHSFSFSNGQTNVPPVLSGLSMPDTVSFGSSFIFSIKASDQNGLSDIVSVFYKLYRPDGTMVTNAQGISEYPLSDNGDYSVTGDVTANDGIYTNKLQFPSGQPTGTWKFVFQAKDRSGAFSNTITHNLVVK